MREIAYALFFIDDDGVVVLCLPYSTTSFKTIEEAQKNIPEDEHGDLVILPVSKFIKKKFEIGDNVRWPNHPEYVRSGLPRWVYAIVKDGPAEVDGETCYLIQTLSGITYWRIASLLEPCEPTDHKLTTLVGKEALSRSIRAENRNL